MTPRPDPEAPDENMDETPDEDANADPGPNDLDTGTNLGQATSDRATGLTSFN